MQIVRNQIIDLIINEGKLDDGSVAYAKLKSADVETTLTGGASKIASAAAIKSYVDGAVQSYTGGEGIAIDGSNVVSVALQSSAPGLEFDGNDQTLKVKLKAESGGSISADANGMYIADSAIGNAKLANSTISGVALGSNLNSLSLAANSGMTMTSFNGSAAVSDLSLVLDGGTLSKGGSGVKVADLGIDTAQLASAAVTADKASFRPRADSLTTNGSTTAFSLANEIPPNWETIDVYRNGLRIEQVASSPSGVDQYTCASAGGTTTVTFGAAPAADDNVIVRYWA